MALPPSWAGDMAKATAWLRRWKCRPTCRPVLRRYTG
uniref:Uncharacterized protein n=2 Tax=unclassified Caudoviricetes TaxID=2788787 RepID=A0A8S5P946_9CAUD|nr:MAG TPA: hypothetical protein [Siphoviridae sp. ctPat53]DAE10409.1 MAG TPA: hypothetical protein [Siphoviridae sp. ct7cV26]